MALLDVILGYDCNLWCDYCTITKEMRRRELPTARVVDAVRRARVLGYDQISFTGGEPTLRADLLPLIRLAKAAGYGDLKVQSNGLLFAHRPNVQRLLDAGVNRFHLSIHAHEEVAYERTVRREGTFGAMVAGLDNLVALAPQLTVDVILKEDTYRKLPEAVAFLGDRGVRSVHLWFVSLTDGNKDHVESMPKMSAALPYVRRAFEDGRARGMDLRSLHLPRCLLGEDAAHAYDPGADRVMVVTPDATFELKDSRLAGRRYVPACEGCSFRAVCPGLREDYLERYGAAEFTAA